MHPFAFAYCTATCPTAPAAADTTTIYPCFSFPILLRPKYAVNPEIPKAPKNCS